MTDFMRLNDSKLLTTHTRTKLHEHVVMFEAVVHQLRPPKAHSFRPD